MKKEVAKGKEKVDKKVKKEVIKDEKVSVKKRSTTVNKKVEEKKVEKKKLGTGIYFTIFLFVLVILAIVLYVVVMQNIFTKRADTIFFVTDSNKIIDETHLDDVLIDLDSTQAVFGELSHLEELDFYNYNYAILQLDYNPCTQENMVPNLTKVIGDDYHITVNYNTKCGECDDHYLYYLVRVPKDLDHVNLKVSYKQNNYSLCN